MSGEKEKRGFWSGLFRSQSSARKLAKPPLERDRPRRGSEGDLLGRRRRTPPPPSEVSASRRRPRRPDPAVAAKGKGRQVQNGQQAYEPGPLSEWPPAGMSSREELSLGHAMELISRGVPAFKGHKRPIPHASDHYYALFASAAGNRGDETDVANAHDAMTQLMSMKIQGAGLADYAWETLEQPSYGFYFGRRPGTVTLNEWVNLSSVLPQAIALRDPGVVPRDVDLVQIFQRVKELQAGLEDDDEDLLYRNLYKRFLRDPDKLFNPHKTLDKQITDLIMVLSRPDWIDFTAPRNQIVTRFIYDTGHANHQQYVKFFHQLVLSLELDLRINSRQHNDWAKEKLSQQLPPRIQWNLALARRWRDNVRVEAYGPAADQVRLRLKLKNRQIKMLRHFAKMMKWPNLAAMVAELKARDAEGSLDTVSSHAMAFFSGLVLPGPTFPFLMMNSLIDIDPDRATDELALLTHLQPHCGFQYRNSYTYWSSTSIVGKVLGPTCREAAGWVGPARPTVDLGRSQIARVRSQPARQRLTAEDVRSMSDRSDPLGPPTEVFPVRDYQLVVPDGDSEAVDTVRIELLSLRPAAATATDNSINKRASPAPQPQPPADQGPRWFDASIQFAIDGVSWPLRLVYDVSFVNAWPCSDGPHPLFLDYGYDVVKADELIDIKDWHGLRAATPSPASSPGAGASKKPAAPRPDEDDEERVLVIEAFGVPDNEVLARAWCAHWGLSAVVADMTKTCMACAIREAYAATITVLILVEDHDTDED